MSGTPQPRQVSAPHLISQQQQQQFSPALDRMPHLKQLVLGPDAASTSGQQLQNTQSNNQMEDDDDSESMNNLVLDELPDTVLGEAVTNLHVAWMQLLMDLMSRTGFSPPTLEHIKEVAECAIRQLKDACHDLTREFARVGIEWRLTHPDEALADDLADYDQAILRQETMLGRAAGVIQRLSNDFVNEQNMND